MPQRGTPRQAIRIPDDLWERLGAAAEEAGTDRSALLRELAEQYLADPGDLERARRERHHHKLLGEVRQVHRAYLREAVRVEQLRATRDEEIRAAAGEGVSAEQIAAVLQLSVAEVQAIIERDQPST